MVCAIFIDAMTYIQKESETLGVPTLFNVSVGVQMSLQRRGISLCFS